MSDQDAPIPGIISQQLFDHYATGWALVINQPDVAALQASFLLDKQLITGLKFSATQLAQLVATIGAVSVKARFLLKPPAPGAQAQFSLALFATDSLDARISSYYVPELVYTDTDALGRAGRATRSTGRKNQLPTALAHRWQLNWTGAAAVVPAFFASHYGPLRGYTFGLEEFITPLFPLDTLAGNALRVSFVLHDFYQPDPVTGGDQLAQTFALVLHLERGDKATVDDDDPLINNGMPCPPNC